MNMKTCLVLTPQKSKFSPLLYAGNMDYGIKHSAELGYDGVELNIRDSKKVDQNHIIEMINSHDLKLVSFGTGQAYYEDGISLADADPKIREKTIKRLKDHIVFASRASAQVVLGSIRGKFSEDPKIKEKEFEGALDAVKKVTSFAEGHGVILTIEPINKNDTNFINKMQEALDFLKLINGENVKLLIDTFQTYQEEDISNAIGIAGNLLVHVHLVDTNRLVPGKGLIDFKPVIKTLEKIGYNRYLSAEVLPKPDDDTAASEFITNVRKLLREEFIS